MGKVLWRGGECQERRKRALVPSFPFGTAIYLCIYSAAGSHLNCLKQKVKSLSRVWLFATPWTVAYHAPPSMRFSRQEYWSGLPLPSPGDLPHPFSRDSTHVSCIGRRILYTVPPRKPSKTEFYTKSKVWWLLLCKMLSYYCITNSHSLANSWASIIL